MNKFYRPVAFLALSVLVGCGGSGTEQAAETTSAPEVDRNMQRAVEVRQAVLRLVSTNFGPMRNMARGEADFDAAVVRKNSLRLHQLSLMLPDAFITDTRGSGVETEALDAVWENPEAFAAKADDLSTAAGALVATTASGDEESILAAIGELGGKCGSCHDDFRLDD